MVSRLRRLEMESLSICSGVLVYSIRAPQLPLVYSAVEEYIKVSSTVSTFFIQSSLNLSTPINFISIPLFHLSKLSKIICNGSQSSNRIREYLDPDPALRKLDQYITSFHLLMPCRLQYSMYGHIAQLAEAEKAGLAKAGIEADIYQIAETLPQEVLTKVSSHHKTRSTGLGMVLTISA